MKCLVTGGAGFIGSNLVEALLERGNEVVVLDNFSTGSRKNLPFDKNAKIVEGDILNFGMVESCIRGVDTVFHIAAEVGNLNSLKNPMRDAQVNILGTMNVLNAAVAMKVKTFVYSSSSAIFGEPQYLPIDESHPTNPESFYGMSKLSGEKYCIGFAKLHDINVVCLRYFNVYGPKQSFNPYANVIPIFANIMLKKRRPIIYGDGEQTRDFVSVEDVVQANLLAAAGSFKAEVFNIGSGIQTTINKLNEIMQNIIGVSLPPVYKSPREGEVRHSVADISKAKALLGYEPKVSIIKGLEKFINWYVN